MYPRTRSSGLSRPLSSQSSAACTIFQQAHIPTAGRSSVTSLFLLLTPSNEMTMMMRTDATCKNGAWSVQIQWPAPWHRWQSTRRRKSKHFRQSSELPFACPKVCMCWMRPEHVHISLLSPCMAMWHAHTAYCDSANVISVQGARACHLCICQLILSGSFPACVVLDSFTQL